MNEFVAEWQPFAKMLARKYANKNHDYADCLSLALESVWEAVLDHEEGGIRFATLIATIFRRKASRLYKYNTHPKRCPQGKLESSDFNTIAQPDSSDGFGDYSQERVRQAYQRLPQTLGKTVMGMYYGLEDGTRAPMEYEAIAHHLGKNIRNVRMLKQVGLRKMHMALSVA